MFDTIYTWRIFCNTENQYVFKQQDSKLSVNPICFNNPDHSVNTSTLEVIYKEDTNDTVVTNLPLNSFNEVRTVERTLVLELKSTYGKSTLRDVYVETGTGTVTNNIGDSLFTLSVSAANDVSAIYSAERTHYIAGTNGEIGISAIIPQQTLTGNQYARGGIFDATDGAYYKYDSTGFAVGIMKESIETLVYRDDWNYDKLDGNGPSKHILDLSVSAIFEIIYVLEGAGSIGFYINTTHSSTKIQNSFLVHIYTSPELTVLKQSNLPIGVELNNNGTAGVMTSQVAGREYSVIGRYNPTSRITSHYTKTKSIGSITEFRPILTVRRKNGYLGLPIRIDSFGIITNANMFVQLRVGASLTGAVYGPIDDVNPVNTGLEGDTSATALTGGKPIFTGLISGNNQISSLQTTSIDFNLTGYDTLTFCAKGVTVTNGTVDSAVVRFIEEW